MVPDVRLEAIGAVLVLDPSERVVAMNGAALRRFGDLEGRPLSSLPPAIRSQAAPAQGARGTKQTQEDASPGVRVLYLDPASGMDREPHQEVRDALLANVSHELRTPLTSVLGFAKLLKAGRGGPLTKTQEDYLDRVLEGGQHLLHLVSDLLDLARIESGHLELRPERTDVVHLVEETIGAVRPLVEGKGLVLRQEGPDILQSRLDPVRFKQVLYNYLSNAIKFTSPGGSVTVGIRDEGGFLRVEVRDTGIGIAADQRHRLFLQFSQIDHGADAPRGAGLGLAITRRIVEAMGGSVGVSSRLGQGSTFWACIPSQPPAVT